jgi:hypothetical protein
VGAEVLEGGLGAGGAAAAGLGLADQFKGLFEGDVDGRQVGREAAGFGAGLDVGAEAAVGGDDGFAGVGVEAERCGAG